MDYFDRMDKLELRELINRNWMTHDAMWFFHSVQEHGIEKTNAINKAAVRSMATVEAKRLKKAFGIETIRTFDELKQFILSGFEVIRGSFMDFRLSFPEENVMEWEVPSCFAYEGVRSLGVIDGYQCAIFDRLDAWLETLGVQYSVAPEVAGCLLHRQGKCRRRYRFLSFAG